ncbi:MAG: hypothetical protein HY674_20295 [Chloroflexi bacterium]|nr:hypothetical protein [Chloroflexota bacterium]
MNTLKSRRQFIKAAASSGALLAAGDLGFLARLPAVTAAEARLEPKMVKLHPDIEPLVRLLEATPRDRLLEEVAARLRRGLSYRELLAALLLAGVRNIQPRPVGFKFHAVLVVNSAHLASLSAPDSDRWLPLFWALDHFKGSQAQDEREGDWRLGPVDESALPSAHQARQALGRALDNWDVAAADAAVASLARTAGAQEAFEIFCRYGARDFRDIGHKAIYVANSWRTLQCIGWQHAEPVLRSLAYALLEHEGENPARRDAPPDRPWKRNQELSARIRADWLGGQANPAATQEMLAVLRTGSDQEACGKAVELLNRGASAQSIWDALFAGAMELLIRQPGIVALHAVTSTNALQFAFQTSGQDESRRLLLLQNAAFLPLFRARLSGAKAVRIDQLEPASLKATGPAALEEILAEISRDRMTAAAKVLAYLQDEDSPKTFMDAARRLLFQKGRDAHDYKFSSAVLEDFHSVSETWRDRYLAASVFNLKGSGNPDNDLVKRTRAALQG